MKKIIRVGRNVEIVAGIIGHIILCGTVLFDFIKKRINGNQIDIMAYIALIALMVTVCVCSVLFIQEYSCYIELREDKLYVKMPFRILAEYSKEEVRIQYGVKVYKAHGEIIYPCLVIGKPTDKIKFTGNYKNVYGNYYTLMILNKRRYKIIIEWFHKKIGLPNKSEWLSLCDEHCNTNRNELTSDVKKYYEMIEVHNDNLLE